MRSWPSGVAAAFAVAAAVGPQVGCAQRQAWQHDESQRIEDVMSSKRFSDDVGELKATPFSAPPSTAPPLPKSSYALQNAPPKKRSKPHRSARGAEVSSSKQAAQRSSHSKRKTKRREQVTSQAAEADSVSRPP